MIRIFTREILVGPVDIDMQNRVNNVCYVQWMQDAAVAHTTALGWDMARYEALGGGWVVRQHVVTYRRPAFLGETLTAATWVASMASSRSLRRYLFWRAADRAVLAEAETLWVFIDFTSGRPVKIPEELRAAFPVVEDAQEAQRMLEDLGAQRE